MSYFIIKIEFCNQIKDKRSKFSLGNLIAMNQSRITSEKTDYMIAMI